MLHDDAGLVCLDALWHHVQNVMHDRGTQLKIILAFDALLRDSLCHTLVCAALKLSSKQVAKPALKQWHNTAQEKEPHTPSGRPEANTRAFAHRACVEPVVDDVLQILAPDKAANKQTNKKRERERERERKRRGGN